MGIQNFDDFYKELLQAGFSLGGGNAEGIYAVLPFNWNEEPSYETAVRWHTGDPETDPWEWRMRVLDEKDDIAYAKVFFKKSGYITKEWYPYFLAVRREGRVFEEDYLEGKISLMAKNIYELFEGHQRLPLHIIKQLAGIRKENNGQFERAMIELQMKMYITMCGRQQKTSQNGEEYGWASTVFTTTEQFWGKDVFQEAAAMTGQEAAEKITQQVYRLNPEADIRKIVRFIK